MDALCLNPPSRPANVEYDSIASLYLRFEEIFLKCSVPIVSPCGHKILIFDHHFFHLAAISKPGSKKLFMKDEKSKILATDEGFAEYILEQNGSRAKHLQACWETLKFPDEIWENNPKAKARWVYIKEYVTPPYKFSVTLVTERANPIVIVPVTSFPCKKTDIRKWRGGKRIFP